nr:putative uncharacterized protein DDB_G0282133 [Dermatophagoides farinae]
MPEIRPEFTRFYHDLATRFHSGINNIRSFGQQITTRFHNNDSGGSAIDDNSIENNDNNNNNNNDGSSTNQPPSNSMNPFLDSSTNNNDPLNPSNVTSCSTNRSSNTNRSNRRSSSRHHHHHHHRHHSQTSSCRDREYHRQAYHPYLFSSNNHHHHLNSSPNNVSIIHRNGLITLRSLDDYHYKDRNVLAAILSIIVIAILATALVQPKWFSIYNDLCVPTTTPQQQQQQQRYFTKSDNSVDKVNTINNNPLASSSTIFNLQLSPKHHYTQYRPQYYHHNNGPFHSSYSTSYQLTPVTIYGLTPDFKTCANAQILALKRTIIGLCFLAIMCTLVQFFMDTMGTSSHHNRGAGAGKWWLNSMRQYAVGNILCVIFCVLIIGLCYFISLLYERVQLQQLFETKTPISPQQQQPNAVWIKSRMISRATLFATTTTTANGGGGGGGGGSIVQPLDYLTIHQIEVKFELSYYLITLAGFLSILASAANLFRRPRQIFIERIGGFNDGCSYNGRYHHHHHNRSLMARRLRSTSNGNHYHNNGDENSLLNSDVLLNNSLESSSSNTTPTSSSSPYDLFTNWTLYCTNSNNNNNHSTSTNGHHSSSIIMPPSTLPPPPSSIIPHSSASCPPPPPYSP